LLRFKALATVAVVEDAKIQTMPRLAVAVALAARTTSECFLWPPLEPLVEL
jgi:hypothetical protein